MAFRRHSVLPGFGLTLGYTVFYLSLIVLLPLLLLFVRSMSLGPAQFWSIVTEARVLASYRLTFFTSLIAAVVDAVFGFIVAWCLVRYHFPGRRILEALVDLPFALPTAVSGIVLTTVYGPNGALGQQLEKLGIKAAYSPLGITIALVFIGVPFVVRMLQPALEDLDPEIEEAAYSLGANQVQTFLRVVLPPLLPALTTGFALSFARALGEYGSVIFIAGNMPMKTEVTSLLIVSKLEQYDYPGAMALATVMLVASFALLFSINLFQWWTAKRYGRPQ